MKTIDIYKELLEKIEGYSTEIKLPRFLDISHNLKNMIKKEEISELFGIAINDDQYSRRDWFKLSEFQTIGIYGGEHGRTISWLDEGTQPENEWLYAIRFPTGAYIFGQQYPTETFNAFFSALKEYKPKYIDSANKCLYFTHETAAGVHVNFWKIHEKYKAEVMKELKEKRAKELRDELAALEQENKSM